MHLLSIKVFCQIAYGWTCVAVDRIHVGRVGETDLHGLISENDSVQNERLCCLGSFRKENQGFAVVVTPTSGNSTKNAHYLDSKDFSEA